MSFPLLDKVKKAKNFEFTNNSIVTGKYFKRTKADSNLSFS
jgi:hypothetical protein